MRDGQARRRGWMPGVSILGRLAGAGAMAVLCIGTVPAATSVATFGVRTNLQGNCRATVNALAFPAYTPGAGARTANTTIGVRCTRNTAFTVSLDAGTTAGASFAQRLMALGAGRLQYNLYTTAARTTVFGDGSASTAVRTGTGAGLATVRNVRVFGSLPDSAANQAAAPGAYSDTITVTVSY
ncbi:MAG: spore coat protein U domain-containing protein [Steroidobacteraceae bacterium]